MCINTLYELQNACCCMCFLAFKRCYVNFFEKIQNTTILSIKKTCVNFIRNRYRSLSHTNWKYNSKITIFISRFYNYNYIYTKT